MARDMDKWLGNGGMPLLEELGLDLTRYGEGWVEGNWIPTKKACNPNGPVQGGVYAVVTDAVMAFATLAALDQGRGCTVVEMKNSFLRSAMRGEKLHVRGEVVHLGLTVAFCRATITGGENKITVEATCTILLQRDKKG